MEIGSKKVILCHRSSYMGCEENVLPMYFPYGAGQSFEFNNLANTGFMGCKPRHHFSFEKIIIFRHPYELENSEKIKTILESYENRYAFFFEKSQRPLEEGYVCRCRFIREDIVPQLYRHSVTDNEIIQNSSAIEILYAFFEHDKEWGSLRNVYGNYYDSPYFRERYMDEENFAFGSGVVWEEQEGIFRAWTRVIYVPK